MTRPSQRRTVELLLVVVAVALFGLWVARRPDSPHPPPIPSPSPPASHRDVLRLAGIALGDRREALTRSLGPPALEQDEGPFKRLDFLDPGGGRKVSILLEARGYVLAVIAEGSNLERGSEVVVRPGDPVGRVLQNFGPAREQEPARLTYRQVPGFAEDFAELTFHLEAGRVSQIALVGALTLR